MTTDAAPPPGRRRRPLRQMAATTVYVTSGGLLLSAPAAGIFTFVSTIIAAVTVGSSAELAEEDLVPARAALIVFTCLIGVATFVLCCFFGRLHRSRAAALMASPIPRPARSWCGWRRILSLGFTPYAVRALTYYILGLLWGPVMITVVLICLIGGPALMVQSVRSDSSLLLTDLLLIGGGAALLFSSPWALEATARGDLALVKWVNGVDEKAALAQRVQQVTEARSGMVAAADAERRRIERNLHDGAQQRLTALAVHLGIERSRYRQAEDSGHPVDTHQTQTVLAYAQDEVQTALQEIRHLVRGLHPAVLEDRGLDAAVSGIASRAPFPVTVDVSVAERLSLEVEAVAYFVVSEAMNNVISHAGAGHATATVRRSGDLLKIGVDDDGVGGAEEHRGTGLTGLRQRVESVDGALQITSEPGEGTQIRVELPCA